MADDALVPLSDRLLPRTREGQREQVRRGPVHLTDPFAAHSGGQFTEPWVKRVRDVDDDTLAGLLKTLIGLRRVKLTVAVVAGGLGSLLFGALAVSNIRDAMLIYGTLAAFTALPFFAGGSLAVRRLFLREAQEHGLGRSTSTLVLTRAERKARFLGPWKRDEEKIALMLKAVRDPDVA